MKEINNRRYIGSKFKLLEFIFENINSNEYKTFSDVFAGTGIVGYKALEKGFKSVIFNDLLFCNYVIYYAFFNNYTDIIVSELINKYNNYIPQNYDNYFCKYFGDKYYTKENATIINDFREEVEILYENKKITQKSYYYLVAVILFAADKYANTTGHFEHYLSKLQKVDKIKFLELKNLSKFTNNIKLYNNNSNDIINKLSADVVYLDPPYNARQYINFYHILENISIWNKPTSLEGKSNKFQRNHLKSDYSKAKAPQVFENLIENIKAKLIVVSYNNTYNAKSSASNNKISFEQMKQILEKKGELEIKYIDYKSFNTGKTNFSNHKELLFLVKCK